MRMLRIGKRRRGFTVLTYNKKGFLDFRTIIIVIALLLLSIISVISFKFFGDINTDIQADSTLSNESKEQTQDLYDRFPATFDGVFALFLGLIWIVTMVLGYNSSSHPVLFTFGIIIIVATLFVGAIFSNTYAEFMATDDFAGIEASFPVTHFVMSNLVIVALVMSIGIGIALYGGMKAGV